MTQVDSVKSCAHKKGSVKLLCVNFVCRGPVWPTHSMRRIHPLNPKPQRLRSCTSASLLVPLCSASHHPPPPLFSTKHSRTMHMRCLPATAIHTALRGSHLPLLHLVRNGDCAITPVSVCDYGHVTSRPVSAGSSLLGLPSRSLCTRALLSGVFWKRQGAVHWPGGFISRSFYIDSVGNQQSERNGSTCGETSPEGSNSPGSAAVRPLQPSHLLSSLVADDFRSLIVSKKREVAILEAALEILETAPRDKWFEDLVRKHNIQLGPFKLSVTQPEKRWEISESLPLDTDSPKLVLGDLVVKSNTEFEPASTVEPTSQIAGFSDVKNDIVENDVVDLAPAKTSDSQQDRRWNTAKLQSQKMDSSTMFGQLSLDNFPSPQDPNLERLQKKRRRQEMMKEHERNSKIESLNFGAAAKSAVGRSNPREESPVDPLRPNASAFLEQSDKKPYRSLADRMYEEQFGRPAPPGLKRTYPKGSFYDRCMKEKEQKEREAAAAAAPVPSTFPPRSVSSTSLRPIESGVSVSSQRDDTSDNSIRKNVIGNDINQERKPGAWKCLECTFFNLATDEYCYRCQAQRGENGRRDGRDSGRRSTRERETT